jgi:hypothetical protein
MDNQPVTANALGRKDRKNREEALCKIIGDAKKLVKSVDIPPAPLTPFEDALVCYIMLACLDFRHYEFFGIPEGQSIPEDVRLNLYGSLSEEQKNVLKRDYLIEIMVQGNGITKRAALLIELAKHHFPNEMAEIENTYNEEYLKKQAVIREQMEKLQTKMEVAIEEVA